MKAVKLGLVIACALGVLYALGRSFVSALGEAPRAAGPQAVLFSAPAGYAIEQGGELSRAEAATRLERALGSAGGEGGSGIHFTSGGSEIYWLVDRGEPQRLVERVAGANGTRIETEFRGDLAKRLAWAAEHGSFDAPGTSAGESRNLYH
jgi:hypothetical protein